MPPKGVRMSQAITTKFHGPTDTKGSRYSATCSGGKVTIPTDYALNSEANHIAAAQALLAKMKWEGYTLVTALNHKNEGVHIPTHQFNVR